MKIDVSKSEYHEAPGTENEWTRAELRRLRQVLRRLRYLEAQVHERGGLSVPNPKAAAAYVELEIEGLELALTELGFIQIKRAQS